MCACDTCKALRSACGKIAAGYITLAQEGKQIQQFMRSGQKSMIDWSFVMIDGRVVTN